MRPPERGGARRIVAYLVSAGPRIPAEHVPRLFDGFWRAPDGRRSGAGLGLYIAKGIVEARGGRIWVETVVGRGTTFMFTLPRPAGGGSETE